MAITTVIKRLLGVEDVNWDSDGSDSRFPVETSTGGTRSVKRVNSSDVPSTSTTRSKERIGSGTPVSGGKDVDGHLQEVYDDLAKIGEPDGVTMQAESGQLKVKEVGPDQIAADAVTGVKLADGAVATANIAASAVTTDEIADTTIVAGNIANTTITALQIAANAVEEDKIKDDSVTPAKMNMNGAGAGPSHYITTAGNSGNLSLATSTISLADGLLEATDVIQVTISDFGTGTVTYIKQVANNSAANTIDVTFSAAPTNANVWYTVFRPVS